MGEENKLNFPLEDYSSYAKGYNLIDPQINSLDLALKKICRKFSGNDDQTRHEFRESLSQADFYTLMNFSRRSAVFAIRERDVDWLINGLSACAVVDLNRIDFRDIHLGLGLLRHIGARIGADTNQLFRDAAEISTSEVSNVIHGYIETAKKQHMAYDEIITPNGIGFVNSGFVKFDPTLNLKQIALEIAGIIEQDQYTAVSITTATQFPKYWLSTDENIKAVEKISETMLGCVSIGGTLRPEFSPESWHQQILIFILEMKTKEMAQTLQKLSQEKQLTNASMTGLAFGRLLGLLIARSITHGVESYETKDSIKRFSGSISKILAEQQA